MRACVVGAVWSLLVFLKLCAVAPAAEPVWTWVKGSNQINQSGVYGTLGVAAPANTPGARLDAVCWSDPSGRLWVFGGVTDVDHFCNDLWCFDPATGNWTWVKGGISTQNQPAVYGTQGQAAPANTPGARYGAATWTDPSGRLWLFGGYGSVDGRSCGSLNDLWRFDPATNNWTWVKGSSTLNQRGVYGTQGVPAPDNTPGARYGASNWIDPSGRLWLFGGSVHPGGSDTVLNDLWCFDPATGNWTWVKGSNQINQPGVYGTQGQADPAHTPGARYGAATWTDLSGRLWLFGGYGLAVSVGSYNLLNDLWRFDPATGNWTWVKGSYLLREVSTPGMQGVAGPDNTLGSRWGAVNWSDPSGRFWLFGGWGIIANAPVRVADLNDLWRYDPATNCWTWLKGDALPALATPVYGTYGTQGVPAPANTPGGRWRGVAWGDTAGRFWIFGGLGYGVSGAEGYLNDLWRLEMKNAAEPAAWQRLE